MNRDRDCLRRFVFERFPVRGEIVHLDETWRTVLERRAYPPALERLLGETMAAAALLYATIKFDGLLTLQLQSQGALQLLLVHCNGDGRLRGLAKWRGEIGERSLAELCPGTLMISIDPGDGERYQGVVSVEGDTPAAVLEHYFERSEQLPTRLHLSADSDGAAGMLLQRLPGASADDDAWNRVERLGATLDEEELRELDAPTLLRRLFHQEDVRLFQPQPLGFQCTCSRERIATMLQGLGYDEVRSILDDEGQVEVQCEFCGQDYRFDAIDAEAIFAAVHQPDVPTTYH